MSCQKVNSQIHGLLGILAGGKYFVRVFHRREIFFTSPKQLIYF